MIKTVELTGSELKVEGLDGKNTAIYNKSDGAVYASCSPNLTPNADGVIEIPAGGYRGLYDTNGIIYLLGMGKAELTGTDYPVNFKMPSSSSGTSGGGGGEKSEKGMYCGITEFVSSNVGVKSTTIDYTPDYPARLAEILAEETGWELQDDGVTVLKDGGVGFKFTTTHVWLANNLGSPNDYNFRYIEGTTSNGITIDVCTSSNGAVAFGCRGINGDGTEQDMSFSFVLAQNADGDDVALAEFQTSKLYLLTKDKSTGDILTVGTISKSPPAVSVTLASLPDVTAGSLLNVFFLLSYSSGNMPGDSIFSIDSKKFRLLKSTAYSGTTLLAIPI